MTRLVFDIYPPDYPVTTTRLVRVTAYGKETTFKPRRPMGHGLLQVAKGQAFVTATNFAIGNYVIVRDLDRHPSNDTANVIGGFYLEEGDFDLVTDKTKWLVFGGRSTISIFQRAIMGPESLSPFEGPHSIEAGYWRWGSDTYGGVMRRALFEANYQDPPGLPMIATLTVGVDNIFWDDDNDSNGNPWPSFTGEFSTQCGTTLLELYGELYGYGVELEIDARTFDVYAYNTDGYGTDRTSATLATGKVRFETGVNIAAKKGQTGLVRSIHGTVRTTHLLVRTTDYPEGAWIASDDYTPGDPVYKRPYQSGDVSGDPKASPVLQSRAQRNMDLRTLGEDGVRLLMRPGADELAGLYAVGPNYSPGPTVVNGAHVWLGDWATLHSGADTTDYQNATKRVEGFDYELDVAGNWLTYLVTGARFMDMGGFGPGLPGPASPTGPSIAGDCLIDDSSLKYGSAGAGGNSPYKAFDCNDATYYASSSPTTAGQYLARDYQGSVTSSRWRILQDTNIASRATAMKIYGTNNSAAWAAVSGSPYNWAGAPDWIEVADVELVPGENSGTYASASYRYWAFQPRTTEGGGQNGWVVYTLEIGATGDTPVGGPDADSGTSGKFTPIDHDHDSVDNGDAAGGDLSGTYPDPTVAGIQGTAVPAPTAGDDGKAIVYDHGTVSFVYEDAGGATDHGALTGLADDDHTHYLNEARHDALEHADLGHYELLMTGSSPPEPLEDGTGTDWLYVWVNP